MDIWKAVAALVLCLLSVSQDTDGTELKAECTGQAADVVFVLDVSTSIWKHHFRRHVLTFVQNVVSQLDVGSGQTHTRVAAITFSNRARLEFALDRYLDKAVLLQKVKEIWPRGGNTNTHRALEFADQHVFQPANGARTNVSRVVVVITDGVCREVEATREAARALRDHGATIFAIGVGRDRNPAQLADMASLPTEDHVFEVTHFKALARVKDKLIHKTCQDQSTTTTATTPTTTITTTTISTTTTPTTTTTTTTMPSTAVTATPSPSITTTTTTVWSSQTRSSELATSTETGSDHHVNDRPTVPVDTMACINRSADVYFVLDTSSSKLNYRFHRSMLRFVRDVIDLFDVGRARTRVGVITFSDVAHSVFGLHSYFHKDELLKAVDEGTIQQTPGLPNTALALQQAGFRLTLEGRSGAQQVIILITDHQSMKPNSTVATARALRHRGVRVLAVGVGEMVDRGELQAVMGEKGVMVLEELSPLAAHSFLLAARSCAPDHTPQADSGFQGCRLHQADVVVAYDLSMLGALLASHISSTLHRLSAILHARDADVRLATVTSGTCTEQQTLPLSNGTVFRKYARVRLSSLLPTVLEKVRLTAFTASNGHRPSARRVVVMVLDAASTFSLPQVALEAAKMRQEGLEIYAVTSGRQWGYSIREVVSQPVLDHVIQLPALDFSNSAMAGQAMARSLCADYRAS